MTYTTAKEVEQEKEDATAVRSTYADSELRALMWHVHEMKRAEKAYIDLTAELEAERVKLLRIKSPEDAEYKKSLANASGELQEKVLDILDERNEARQDYEHSVSHIRAIGKFLQSLDPLDAEIISRRYEMRETYQTIGDALYMTVEAVRKRITKALMKW